VLLDELQEVISDNADPLLVLPEVERLADELERHLSFEEEQLIPILDAQPELLVCLATFGTDRARWAALKAVSNRPNAVSTRCAPLMSAARTMH
jgi:hypothetical protein